jgi:hypothetical protein
MPKKNTIPKSEAKSSKPSKVITKLTPVVTKKVD